MRPAPGAEERFEVAPWELSTTRHDPETMAATESLFALSNGHLGMRGTLEEGEPRNQPGTYLNGFFEERPLPHAERGFGFPESSQTIVGATDGTLVRLFVGDSPFDVRYGTVQAHRRTLDLRAGTLRRTTEWTAPNGCTVRVRSERLVSFEHRSTAAIRYEVEALDGPVSLALQSDLLANDAATRQSLDPRDAAVLDRPLVSELVAKNTDHAVLVHRTARSGLRVAAGMRNDVQVPGRHAETIEASDDLARWSVTCRLARGERLRLDKLLAYGWSSRRSAPALRDQVDAALAMARLAGWDELAAAQREQLDRFWSCADVEVDGDPLMQQAVRLSMFHVLQATTRAEGRPVGAKGLTGPGYDGHTFWDLDAFVLPMLRRTAPHAARDLLRWRHATLPLARQRAAELGLDGAAFPWRTIHGEECSAYWPAGTAAFHVNAAVADAAERYVAATGDEDCERAHGLELLVETARLWASLGHYSEEGAGPTFRIDGVTGPDEYTAIADDNVYTNLMARRNLRAAAAAVERHPDVATVLGVTDAEVARWRRDADATVVPYDEVLGVHPQSEGFTEHAPWDFEATPETAYPLLLHFPYFQLYRKRVTKQADLVLALHLCSDEFTPEQKERDFAYYEALTVRDSSLSASSQAVVAAEVGHLRLAYDYWAETALTDLHDLHRNVDDGVHLGAMAGAWSVAVAGFGGLRECGDDVAFAPRLPPGLRGLGLRLLHRGRVVAVRVEPAPEGGELARYRLLAGGPLTVRHHGDEVRLVPGAPAVALPVPPAPEPAPVAQPHGRSPLRRVPPG